MAVHDLAITEAGEAPSRGYAATRTSPGFARLCAERARTSGPWQSWSVASNGAVLEQSQVLTSHNLATLVHRVGIAPSRDGRIWRTGALPRCAG
ncbi:hypothetical protein [Streptomyces rimosus]|uniref:hypothetical protein n=1 Tax=Streptomyces rimosus TaxID=1927 RepID=UPI0006B2A17A|nr:hypothetical protein [Streptomyces rimosus]